MSVASAVRLPGVDFRPAPSAPAAVLPPLDVAGFVGFATRGPLSLAVPLDDLKGFDAVFGGALELARSADGKPVTANLRDAVAGFFGAGGQRCHVVRVDGPQATAARFELPGLLAIDADGGIAPATVDASSPGAWGNALRLGTLLSAVPLPPGRFTPAADGLTLDWISLGAPGAIQPGELLRLSFAGLPSQAWLFGVAGLAQGAADVPRTTLLASKILAVRYAMTDAPAPAITRVWRGSDSAGAPLDVTAVFVPADSGIALVFGGTDAPTLVRGDTLLLQLADTSLQAVTIAEVRMRSAGGSPAAAGVSVSSTELVCLRQAPSAPARLPAGATLQRVDRLQLNMRVKLGDTIVREIGALGFDAGHPRFWSDIAVAESGPLPGAGSAAPSAPAGQAFDPGEATTLFTDLFGSARVDVDWTDARLPTVLSSLLAAGPALTPGYMPVGMAQTGDDADLVEASAPGTDDLGTFSASLFLDPYLVDAQVGGDAATPGTLLAAASDRYFLQNVRLTGIHGLMFVDEVASIAVPDAMQPGWTAGLAEPPTTATVGVAPLPAAPATFATCDKPPLLVSVQPDSGALAGGALVSLGGTELEDVTTVTFGSQKAAIQSVSATAIVCIVPPGLAAGNVAVTASNFAGTSSAPDAFVYVASPTVPPLPTTVDAADYAIDPLLAVHAALIRLCEARSDAVAILALPLPFEQQDCMAWLQQLRQRLGLPRRGSQFSDAREIADLSYAAVYHPWLLVPDANGPAGRLRAVPPEGAVCGAIAARERATQVWYAPANVALAAVLDLQPAFGPDDEAALFTLAFNLVRREADNFRIMSANTLSDQQALRELSVRRLMIQLRKALLQRGEELLFANNGVRLAQRVRVWLEDLLGYMFARNAFAGSTPQASYRIAVDASVNTPADADAGRIIAQVLVAPSQPMEFISVSLNRTGQDSLQASES
jgi:hypothetical protein